jgi:hypothetical protein
MKTARQMNALGVRLDVTIRLMLLLLLPITLIHGVRAVAAQIQTQEPMQGQTLKQTRFATPEEAMRALVEAAKTKDHTAQAAIFGPETQEQMLSGDDVQDNQEMEEFAAAVDKSVKLEKVSDTKFILTIGEQNWPFPIPVVKEESQWRFDTQAGLEEIWNRRVGENELSTILACRAYVLAQWEYFTQEDVDNDGVAEYAQKFMSSPGKRDGLYWDTAEGEKPSPLGSLVASARAEGYGGSDQTTDAATAQSRKPYHGYYFKILTRQGPHAPGGQYNYIINGNMIAGYAMVAYPDKWGSSGVMTFIVNQQGRVYEKNLGPETSQIAGAMIEYNPDPTWKFVKE